MAPLLRNVKKALKTKKLEIIGPSKRESEIYADAFDPDFYRQQSGKPNLSDDQALRHYLTSGWQAGYDPSSTFSSRDYLAANPDVSAAGIDPLTHYLNHGINEMRAVEQIETHHGKINDLQLGSVKGWGLNTANPEQVFDVRILIDGHPFCTVKNDKPRGDLHRAGIAPGHCGIHEELPLRFMEAGEHTVALEMPDGSRVEEIIEVPDQGRDAPKYPYGLPDDLKITVVVPIYNAVEDVAVCIERLIAYTPKDVKIILIDDCSPDPQIKETLKTVKGNPHFRVLSNKKNLGFTKTVNRGLKESGDADVIILNSDARVTPRWVDGMRTAAYARRNIATVTAMSDRAGAFSAPEIGNENDLPMGVEEADYARAFRRRSLRLYPEVPTGNGFCMYMRRAALDALGPLDEVAFPRGYGEENDYCMRALRAGWSNIIDDATYVFHDRSKSFGETKSDNIAKGRAVVDERYPEYKTLIRKYHTSILIRLARFRALMALSDCSSGKSPAQRALYVTATQTGGTPQTNADLMGALDDAFDTWVLRCSSREVELAQYQDGEATLVRRYALPEQIEPATHRSRAYDEVVADWLLSLDADIVHIRHLAWHSLSLPTLAKRAGAKVFYSLHDFYTLCPSLKLLDNTNTFCGGTCTAGKGTCRIALWDPAGLPPLKNAWLHKWRERMAEALAPVDGFITTSSSARTRVLEHMPSIPEDGFHVIPHGRDFPRFEQIQNVPNFQDPIRILVPGNIDDAKGLNIILEVMKLDVLGMFEFHILGNVKQSLIQGPTHRLILHGKYERDTLAEKVREIAPHFGVILSIWDETFCHTLTELWSVGLPAAVLDFPTLRARVEDTGAGWIIEDISAKGVHSALSDIANDHADMLAKGDAAVTWQLARGAGQTCRLMAARYMDVYRAPDGAQAAAPNVAVVVPSNGSLHHAHPSSEIRVWERTRNRMDRPINYIRMDTNGLLANMQMGNLSGAIIQRTAMPTRVINRFIEAAKAGNMPYVYEIDDNLLDVPADKDPDGYYRSYAPFLTQLIENAAAVTVATDQLAQKIKPLNPRIEVLPNKLSTRLWGGADRLEIDHLPRLLYMGTTTHDADLEFLLPAVEAARASVPMLELNLVGVTLGADLPPWVNVINVDEAHMNYRAFVPWLKSVITDIDLAVAPLMAGEFNAYKSGLKVLDYAALGLPVLASQVPPYQALLGKRPPEGVTLLPNTTSAWTQAIVTKLRKRSVLHAQGADLRNWALENHALEPTLDGYDTFIAKIIS